MKELDRDEMIDELENNIDCAQRARIKLEDLNMDLDIEEWEMLKMHLANSKESLRIIERVYEKHLEKLGGNTI